MFYNVIYSSMRFIVLSRDVPIRYKYILASDWPAWKNVDPDLFPPKKNPVILSIPKI